LKSLKYGRQLPLFKDLRKSSHNRGLSTALVGAAALLLPPPAAPDSHFQAQTGAAASSAAAHVNFEIIIPPALYLHVASANEGAANPRVAIMSHNYMRAATRKIIAQEAVCTPSAGAHRGMGHGNGLVCTASIP
jgi:hypothetical protein